MNIFDLILIIFVVIISISTVNAAELENMTNINTNNDILISDVSQDNSTPLLSKYEKSTLIQNNTISDFNNNEYTINEIDLSTILVNLGMNNMNYDGLKVSISNVQYENLNSNNGLSSSAETINLIKNNIYTPIYNNNLNSNPIIKTKYDLRNDGYVSSIKNQFGNSCWAHAALSALESCILKATGVEYDFSEVKLSNLADEYLGTGTRNGRGNILMSIGYINSWLGTVKENSNSNDSIINVQNIYIISSDNFESEVKEAILKYGGVVASYYSADKYYNENNYYNYGAYDKTNHEITIIGWDDNYNKNNFKNMPKNNGAWICKNSYGSSWGDNGYFYISYYDKTLGKISPSYTFILNDSTKYNKNYQYDIQKTDSGDLDSMGYRYFKNTFTSTSDEKLVAISSYFNKNIKYEISIKVANSEVISRQVFKSNIDGYLTVKLSKIISINKGQQFEVIIHNCNNSHFEICLQNYIHKKLPTNVSYVSKNGKNWGTADNFVCCIKAFTTTSTTLQNRYDLISSGLTKYYGNSQPLTVTFKTYDGGFHNNVKIKFEINGKEYVRNTNANGYASININLNSGRYAVPIYLNNNFKQIKVTVTVKSTIEAKNVLKTYKNATQYEATFLNKEGNPLKNTNIKFNINGVFYTRNTNNAGVATLNINLVADEYIITTYNLNTGEQISNKISVLSSISGGDIVKYFRNGTQYHATFYNSDGKVLINREVTFNINGVFYTRKTDGNGVATLNINLNPGTYIITATNPINGEQHSNEIKVLSKLNAKDISKMRFKDGTKFEVTVLDDVGMPVGANTQVVFNVNGRFYTRSTDSNGIAGLTINLVPGDYIITTTYDGENISNKIHIVP